MRIGILGSGQLGFMMILESRNLGYEFATFDTNHGPSEIISDAFYGPGSERAFVDSCDIVTYEFEHVSETTLLLASQEKKLIPGIKSVDLKRDRLREKQFLRDGGFPVADFEPAFSAEEALRKSRKFGRSILKMTTGGYDGKGQFQIDWGRSSSHELPDANYVVEEYVDFDYEASVIVAREGSGNKVFFKPAVNVNHRGILLTSSSPAEDHGMEAIAGQLADRLDYQGVLAVEFFVKDGKPMVNEFAPRVHNSGHHTLHGTSISQFEQHVRAIAGLPLIRPKLYQPSGIVNIIGRSMDEALRRKILGIVGTKLYWYGKEPKRARKLGHVNIIADTADELEEKISRVKNTIYGGNIDDYF
ncbi:MAG: 5-(carboxyamino)imidazole ribonucleotide synthase [Candidatus Thermoplasmatota archaeon]|jgi:5-(carboxyamino)imidazole ribonucleotide synthase|nr:5-(carboxyamino)imidazole ribonucleotide synthase [Candidatus Thermoplasmatota archaeon]MCL5794718.1 5-(carboxyamino)imidazole ribonucleotide synthase [Candidatus Thermoplasmatota archaeon]